jgi:hypothetical protein
MGKLLPEHQPRESTTVGIIVDEEDARAGLGHEHLRAGGTSSTSWGLRTRYILPVERGRMNTTDRG